MWLIGVRDLQWRRRRFAAAVLAASLMLALALLLSGVSASFDNEIHRTVDSFGADAWLVRAGSLGPFTAPTPFPASWVDRVSAAPGVRTADPVVIREATTGPPHPRQVNVNGVGPGGVTSRSIGSLHRLRPGTALVDSRLDRGVGDEIDLNGKQLRVVGVLHGRTYFAGVPTIVVTLRDAQRIGLAGLPLATAIVTRGVPASVPRGLGVLTRHQVVQDLGRPVANAKQTIELIRILLWLVAGAIIGTFVYLSALERVSEFAVLKAIGVTSRTLLGGLLLQTLVTAFAAAAVAIGLEAAVAPASALSVEVPALDYVLLPLVAAAGGLVASVVALRKAVSIDPALAFAAA